QEIPVASIETQRGMVLYHGVGTGKTLTAVASVECLLRTFPGTRALIITPPGLQVNFKASLARWGVSPLRMVYLYRFLTIRAFYNEYNHRSDDELREYMSNRILVIDESHNLKFHLPPEKEKPSAEGSAPRTTKTVYSTSGIFGLHVPAATTTVENIGKVATFYGRVSRSAFRVILLTATPVVNRPTDLISQISMVDGTRYMNVDAFDRNVWDRRRGPMPMFNDYFGCRVSDYNPPQGSSTHFPARRNHVVSLIMDDVMLEKYDEIETAKRTNNVPAIADADTEATEEALSRADTVLDSSLARDDPTMAPLLVRSGVFFDRLRQSTNNLEGPDNPKVQFVLTLLQDVIVNKARTVIYSNYVIGSNDHPTALTYITAWLGAHHVPYGVISGNTSKPARAKIVEAYNNGTAVVLIISRAGGEGLDLKETRQIVILEPYWNRAIIEQVIGRGIRYDSHDKLPVEGRTVDIYELLLVKPGSPAEKLEALRHVRTKLNKDRPLPISVDEMMYNFSANKQAEIDRFTDALRRVA
ncbi:MAG: hypothetical protein EPO09_21280, partial [Aquabacterium sp.]